MRSDRLVAGFILALFCPSISVADEILPKPAEPFKGKIADTRDDVGFGAPSAFGGPGSAPEPRQGQRLGGGGL